MDSVKVKKEALVDIVTENKAKHIEEFKEAFDGYKEELAKALQKTSRLIKKDEDFEDAKKEIWGLMVPLSHEKEYEQLLKMLEMSVDKEIELSEHDFNMYVMDEWSWKGAFRATNTFYSK